MLLNLKALVVVLAIASLVFVLARPLCLLHMTREAFERRRNVWFALTLTAFFSPSFWLYVLVAILVLAWAGRKDENPVALFLLVMHAIPPIEIQIPPLLVNQLFGVNNYRILTLAVLLPALWGLGRWTQGAKFRLSGLDLMVIAFGVLHLVSAMQYESFTNTMRRGFLYIIDVLVLYLVASRTCASPRALAEAMACYCLACGILAPIAVFESARGWLLYQGLGTVWGYQLDALYLLRGDSLRASASAGHALALGYMLSVAFGFWLYLCRKQYSLGRTVVAAAIIWLGLLAAYSRAPWLVAVLIFFLYLALRPGGLRYFSSAALVATVVAGLVLVSPIGDRVIDNLPFIGSVDSANVAYRQQLASASWEVIRQYPMLGSPFFLSQLESLRQGQGIIDLVNAYAGVAMRYGLVGLFFMLGPFLIGMWRVYRFSRTTAESDPDRTLLGVNLIACMLGTMLMMATGSFGSSLAVMFYVFTGLAVGFAASGNPVGLDKTSRAVPTRSWRGGHDSRGGVPTSDQRR